MTTCKNCGHEIEKWEGEVFTHKHHPYGNCTPCFDSCGCTSPEPLTEADRWADEQLEQQKEDRLVGVLP